MLKDLHYMIVDDEPLAIDVIENYLQRLDASAITRCGNAVEGFELEVVDYLVKPISFPRFMKALEKVGKRSLALPHNSSPAAAAGELSPAPAKEHLFLKVDKKFIKLLVGDILYIESLKDYVRVRTRDSSYITYQSLTEITEKLPAAQFARVHRSYTIALDKIKVIDGNCVDIDGKLIPVSRENRQEVFRKLRK